jgi:3-polyprenyl-4-hydroxybenzoate decarboxylase
MIKIALGVAPATASAGNMPAAPTNTRAAYAAALVTRRTEILLKK